ALSASSAGGRLVPVPGDLLTVAAYLHAAPVARAVLGGVVEGPAARITAADLEPLPRTLRGSSRYGGQERAQGPGYPVRAVLHHHGATRAEGDTQRDVGCQVVQRTDLVAAVFGAVILVMG